jgi:hypothetical protein
MQMAWIGAIRAGVDPVAFLTRANGILANPEVYYPNFYPLTGGGGIEQAGVTLAVDEMLMQSHEGFVHLFPVWPVSTVPAAFSGLRAVGAYVVAAKSDPKEGIGSVVVRSTVGGLFRLASPWAACTQVLANGVRMRSEGGPLALWSVATVAGTEYRINCQQQFI